MYLNIEYKYLNSFSIFNPNYFLCNASASIKQYCRMVHEMTPRNESVFVKQLQSVREATTQWTGEAERRSGKASNDGET